MLCHTCRNFAIGVQPVSAAVQRQPGFLLHIPGQRPDDLRRNIGRIGYDDVKLRFGRHPGPDIRLQEPGAFRHIQQPGIFSGHRQRFRGNIHRQPPAPGNQLQQRKQNRAAAGTDIQYIDCLLPVRVYAFRRRRLIMIVCQAPFSV